MNINSVLMISIFNLLPNPPKSHITNTCKHSRCTENKGNISAGTKFISENTLVPLFYPQPSCYPSNTTFDSRWCVTYPWSAWDSRQIRRPRRGRCHKGATWRSCVRRGHGPDKTAQPSHSSGQIANTWSDYGCGRTDSSLGPATRRSEKGPLQQDKADKLEVELSTCFINRHV